MFSVPFACVFVQNSHDQTRIGADSIVFVFAGVAYGKTDLRVPYKDIKDNKISLEVLNVDSIPLKHPSSYEAGTLKRIISLKDDIIFRLNNPASIPSPTSATTTTTLGMSTSLSVPGVATTTSESVTTHNQTGVPNGAARQNTCSSGRI